LVYPCFDFCCQVELAVGLKLSARECEARLRGLVRAVGVNPSARQGEARLRRLLPSG